MDCISLSEVVFPAKLNSLADSCFSNCSLTKVDLFKCTSLTVISNNAFNSNFNLELVILPPNLDKIGRYAFSGSAITNLSLPNSVSILDQFSFMNCKQLSLFSIPQNSQLTTIGVGVFKGCVSIETISSESSSFSIVTGALFDSHQTNLILFPPASPVKYFSMPSNTQTINEGAFIGCNNLLSIFIPSNTITRISNSAFEDCVNLAWLNIPICVSSVGANAFEGCISLKCGLQRNSFLIW